MNQPHADALQLLAGANLIGLAWLDGDLIVQECFGPLSSLAVPGEKVTDCVLPLFGFDQQISALVETPDRSFEMPNVAVIDAQGAAPRLNLCIYWMPERRRFLLYISKVQSTGDLEIGLAQQVRARMIVEAELAQKSQALAIANTELMRVNRELEEFAYVMSHDLKAPLRAMRYFAEDIQKAVAGPGNGNAAELARSIEAQSRRMSQMLTDLLRYAKIGRKAEALEIVDTRDLVERVAASIPRPAGLRFEIAGDWPTLQTLVAPLDVVLRNLIANAVQHHDLDTGRITVTAQPGTNELTISVCDDGPGIGSDHHASIFLPFRTVAAETATHHSGIGLALVRKTLETVGGTITVVSEPAQARGTTFKLAWPLRPVT